MPRLGVQRLKIRRRFSHANDVTLFHGDCLDLLRSIPDEAARLVITSPPYNVGKSYEKRIRFGDYLLQQEQVIAECVRIVKPGGSICWQVGHQVNRRGQVVPLDLALHPLFAEQTNAKGAPC